MGVRRILAGILTALTLALPVAVPAPPGPDVVATDEPVIDEPVIVDPGPVKPPKGGFCGTCL